MNRVVEFLAAPFLSAFKRCASGFPGFAAAFILLLAGIFTARALRTLLERALAAARLDEHTSKVGINEVLSRLGLGKSPAYALSFLIYWFVLFVFIVSAANAVNMTVVSDLLERFLLFLPSMTAAILILFAGLLFARFVSEVMERAAQANNVRGGGILAPAAYLLVMAYSAMSALEQLGVRASLITSVVQIVLGAAGLAAAIAFGLGAKDVAAETVRGLLKRE